MSLLLRWGFTVLRLFLALQEKIINKIQEKKLTSGVARSLTTLDVKR